MLMSAARFAMDGRDYLVINARDVTETERTRLEHAAILERASIGIAFTRDRRFVQANPRFEAIFGWDLGELAGKPGAVVWADDDDYAEVGRLAGPLLSAGQPFEIEREMRRKDGSRFWCRLLAQVVDRSHPSHGGTIWIADDVTERRRLDAALAAARDAAEAASRAKSAFLANTSHEIRTPLNGLLGLARLAMRPDIGTERRHHYLEQILDSAQSLAGILSDILDFSKIEAGKIALEDMPFDLREALAGVHQSYRTMAEAKGLSLRAGDRPRAAGARQRRPGAGAPDPRQLHHQRAQVHRARQRPHRSRRARNPARCGSRSSTPAPASMRRRRSAALPAVLAGRRLDHAALRRHRPGPVDLPRAGAA